ncbi:restriction endonuclease subunit S [uncultured Clostridium sp.]|uniref:restriction endonuclease subunit S n=1 Tax=uncultured Clostridium sp. TaxID=59620 RepID=UPI00259154FD|nr:restriction endonuclease subunit S [uncultured Clostridium sp.]
MAKKKMTLEEKLEEAIVKDAPYEVPDNWINVKLNSIVKFEKGKKPKILIDDFEDKAIPYVTIKYFQTKEADQYTFETETNRLCKEDDILIVWDGARAGLIGTGVKGALGSTLCNIRLDDINKKFMYYYFLSKYDLINSNTKGTGIPHVDPSYLDTLVLSIPPLKEQQRIVDRIESLFEKLDKAKELIEEARDDFEKRKSAILEKAFRGELTKVWRKENNINREWKREKLKDITKITSGGTPSRKHPEYFEGKIPWIKTGEILWNKIYDSEEHITEEAIANSSAKLIPEGAVLVAMYGQGLTRGRASILEKEACTNQAVCALIPSDAVLNSYLYYYFMSNYWRFRQVAKGGNQENLSGKVIGAFEIDIPSIEEQNEIVRILDKLLEEESKIEELTTLEEQIELIKKSILAKAFRGQLGTNCEDDESALELLKEILSKE